MTPHISETDSSQSINRQHKRKKDWRQQNLINTIVTKTIKETKLTHNIGFTDSWTWTKQQTRLELTPTKKDNETKQTTIWTSKDSKKSDLRVLAEFKVENTNPGLVRKLQKSMEDNNVPFGILVTLEPATADMQKIADAMGKYDYRGLTYPRLQFWQITDGFFKNPEIGKTLPQLPGLWHLRSKKKTRHPIPIPSPKTDAFS